MVKRGFAQTSQFSVTVTGRTKIELGVVSKLVNGPSDEDNE
jgi:hypothetical protein